MDMNPFNLAGGPFLALYLGLLLLTVIAGIAIPIWLRPEGQSWPLKDQELIAYLAGGHKRFAETVVAELLGRGAMVLQGRHFAVQGAGEGRTSTERDILEMVEASRWPRLMAVTAPHAAQAEDLLVQRGLIMSRGEAMQMGLFQTLPYFLLLAFGAIKWEVGVSRDRPVGFLTALLAVTAILALIRFFKVNRRTQRGEDAIVDAKLAADRLNRAPTVPETGMAVALFGTSVLVASELAPFHRLRAATSGDGGSSGCGSSGGDGGGSGCGGGGCGGCGS